MMMIMIKVQVKAQPVYRINTFWYNFTIYIKVNLESIKWLSNKDLKLFTELALTTKEGKLFQSLTNLFKK